MKRERAFRSYPRWSPAILLLLAVFTFPACDNEVIVSPSVTGIDFGPGSVVGVAIVTSLSTADPVCQEATLFYDGFELPGARTSCSEPSGGCTYLKIEGIAPLDPGPHTIGIQVLSQKRETARYLIGGEVLVQRSGIPPIMVLPMESRARDLRVGDRVTYEVHIPG